MALPMMSATEVARAIAENTGVTQTDVKHVLDDLKDLILSELEDAHRFKIAGVVQLEPKVRPARKARMGRNPATGESIPIAAKPADAVVRARVLTEAKQAVPSVGRLRNALSASKPAPRKTKGKVAKKKAKVQR